MNLKDVSENVDWGEVTTLDSKREMALDLAVKTTGHRGSPAVIACANEYLNFLKGEDNSA